MTAGSASRAAVALEKCVTVPCARERAFELFVDRISDWWPRTTHSVGGERAASVRIEGCVGGHVVESLEDGTEEVWGTVTSWERPTRLAFTWHPGRPQQQATTVEVTFQESDGQTLVTLVHRGWARRVDAETARRSYDTGWETVLGQFAARASARGDHRPGEA